MVETRCTDDSDTWVTFLEGCIGTFGFLFTKQHFHCFSSVKVPLLSFSKLAVGKDLSITANLSAHNQHLRWVWVLRPCLLSVPCQLLHSSCPLVVQQYLFSFSVPSTSTLIFARIGASPPPFICCVLDFANPFAC